MQAPSRGPVRLVRAGMLGAVSLALAGGAHVAGGGGLPALPVLAFLVLMTAPIALFVTDRRCRLPRVLSALGVEQGLLHAAFSVTTGAAGCTGARLVAVGHHVLAVSAVTCRTGAAPGAGSMPVGSVPGSMPGSMRAAMSSGAMDHAMGHAMGSWQMVATHVGATLLTAWVLARGEAALWALAERIVPRSLPSVVLLPVQGRPADLVVTLFQPVLSWWADGTSPPGPPARGVPGFA